MLDSAQFSNGCRNLGKFGMPVLHESGKVRLQILQLGKAGLGVTGTGDPLGEMPTSAKRLDRSHPFNSESVLQQLDQIEHCALRIVEHSTEHGQILSALERVGMTVSKDPTPPAVDRPHFCVRLVQLADLAAELREDVLHAHGVRMVGSANPNPVVTLIEQLQQRTVMVALACPDRQLQPGFQRSYVIVAQNLPLSLEHLGEQICSGRWLAGSARPDCAAVSDVQCQWVVRRQNLLGIGNQPGQVVTLCGITPA